MKLNMKKRKSNTTCENQFHGHQCTKEPFLNYDQITDSEGLQRAYAQGDYYVHGRTMFIAGSHTARDWFDDFTKVPAWDDSRDSERYQKTLEGFKNQEQIDTVVGHSLGGSVSLEFKRTTRTELGKGELTEHP